MHLCLIFTTLFIALSLCLGFQAPPTRAACFGKSALILQAHSRSVMFSRTRKDFITSAALLLLPTSLPTSVLAFPNKIDSRYDDRPKQRGSVPKDLGYKSRQTSYGDSYAGELFSERPQTSGDSY